MTELDNFYLQQNEPIKSCLLALRQIILSQDQAISEAWKYGMPFFCYQGKMFCYVWVHKKHRQPYIGMVEGKLLEYPGLIIEKRSKMKIMLFNASKDLPLDIIETILQQALYLYKSGQIKVKDR